MNLEHVFIFAAGAAAGFMFVRSVIASRRQWEREEKEWDHRVKEFLAMEERAAEEERRLLAEEIVEAMERRRHEVRDDG